MPNKYLKWFYGTIVIGSIISLGITGITMLVIYLAHPINKLDPVSYPANITYDKNSQELQSLIEQSELVECINSVCQFVNSYNTDKIIKSIPDGKYIVFVNSNFTEETKNKYHEDLVDFWLAFNRLNN